MPRVGQLLIASVDMGDNYFFGAVILLLDVDETGAIGVIINRASDVSLSRVIDGWEPLMTPPGLLFHGGPVSTDGAICLARVSDPNEEPPGWRRVFSDVGLLHLDTPTEIVAGGYSDLRVFAGYAGWAPGQLEAELVRGDWYIAEAKEEDAFSIDQAGLWRRVVRRLPGDLPFLTTWTPDADRN